MFGFGKGKIEIQLSNFNYSPGDVIEGTIKMNINKPIKARGVKIRFYGEKEISNFDSSTKRNIESNKIIFDFTQPLDGEKEYLGESSYNFKIKIPKDIPSLPDGVAGTVVKSLQILSNQSSRTNWYLNAFLDIPMGFDVSKKVQINIA